MNLTEEQQEHIQGRLIKNSTVQDNGCWTWNLYVNKRSGYGQFWAGRDEQGKYIWKNAHRVSYEVFHGEVPEGLEVAHKCHCRDCVNPNHLIATTHQENVQMSIDAGRWCRGEDSTNSRLTEEMVRTIKQRTIFNHLTVRAVANIFEVHVQTIRAILRGDSWNHIAV